MVLRYYGYTIGDTDADPSLAGNQLQVFRFAIPPAGSSGVTVIPELVGLVTVPTSTSASFELEGLGTNPVSRRVSAVNEPKPGTDPDLAIRVGPVDRPFGSASIVTPTRTPSNLNRFGTESGADFGRDFSVSSQPVVLYNLSSNDDPDEGPIGSSLYKITTSTPGTISLVDSTPTAAEIAGTTPTNPGKYADGLAVDNLMPGRYRALASDIRTTDDAASDPTKNNLYKVDLLTGQLSAPIALYSSLANNRPLALNLDSGLAFTRVSTSNPGGQRLVALLEDGKVIAIQPTDSVVNGITRYGYLDDFNAAGLGIGDGRASAFLLGRVDFAAAGGIAGADYEGFAAVYEDSITG
ncbi:hypothetical protein [Dendronalium sp. ChiSLP03b]|uniref:hypothetical protein n=1 Tax=Dendronalium sp. ChiSLP03b TaxID=3075381 RepID=UPI002AD519C0|nr:hypothetical protein [Dendronalium sp. ChiSLP03b]MDZ8209544.1 hypothetical protein [Dendronalium sp. ChiSLP03b]